MSSFFHIRSVDKFVSSNQTDHVQNNLKKNESVSVYKVHTWRETQRKKYKYNVSPN